VIQNIRHARVTANKRPFTKTSKGSTCRLLILRHHILLGLNGNGPFLISSRQVLTSITSSTSHLSHSTPDQSCQWSIYQHICRIQLLGHNIRFPCSPFRQTSSPLLSLVFLSLRTWNWATSPTSSNSFFNSASLGLFPICQGFQWGL
jgi:hypothetical protein